MQELRLFYLPSCPYCKKALAAIDELKKEPRYADIEIIYNDERKEADLANSYDYWNVPTFFLGDKKLYEAKPGHTEAEIKAGVKESLEAALAI